MDPIYLDYNATTPHAPEVAAAMRSFLEGGFGNPSSAHALGRAARQAVERARGQVAGLLGCAPDEVVFTSGGSEANNHALRGVIARTSRTPPHVITSSVEHPAVLAVCDWLRRAGCEITLLPVDGHGRVDPGDLAGAIRPGTALVTIMHANNEVGTLQPLTDLARIARDHDVPFHTDAAQTPGKVPVAVAQLGVGLLSLAGHKLYGPKGVGALYVRRGVDLEPLIHGAGHEGGRRAGTENVMLLAGLGAACVAAARDLPRDAEHLRRLRERLRHGLERHLGPLRVHGHPEACLPNTLSVAFPDVAADRLLAACPGVAASAGSACHAGETRVSPVLQAMGVPTELARGTVRLSVGKPTSEGEVDEAVERLVAAYRAARS